MGWNDFLRLATTTSKEDLIRSIVGIILTTRKRWWIPHGDRRRLRRAVESPGRAVLSKAAPATDRVRLRAALPVPCVKLWHGCSDPGMRICSVGPAARRDVYPEVAGS